MFRFSISTCRSLFICDFSFHSGFEFLSVVYREGPIFSQINFALAYIKSFNSLMSFVGIIVNKSFNFSVSDLTFHQSWFLRESNVVFFSDMILLMIFTFIFSSRVNVCVCVFAVYQSLSCSVWLGVCVFPCLGYCIRGLLMCLPIYLWMDFQYFRIRKLTILCYCPNLVSKSLVCCLKSSEFCLDFNHSFSIHFFVGLLLK